MRFVRATVAALALCGGPAFAQEPVEQPVEKCLPGSSCWARLQSVESLGARTADVAKEVERLAKLALVGKGLGEVHGQLDELNLLIESRKPFSLEQLDRVIDTLASLLDVIDVDDARYADYALIEKDIEEIRNELSVARRRLEGMGPGGVDKLATAVELLAHKLAMMSRIESDRRDQHVKPRDPDSVPSGRAAPKISANDRLVDVYGPNARFDVAVMAVPDPRIPRYRRSFDLKMEATMRAMSAHGAHLDRFEFPWGDDQKPPCPPTASVLPKLGRREAELWKARPCDGSGAGDLGIITFRKDCRHAASPAGSPLCSGDNSDVVRVVALYLVPERGTDGPDHHAAVSAFERAASQVCRAEEAESRKGSGADLPAAVRMTTAERVACRQRARARPDRLAEEESIKHVGPLQGPEHLLASRSRIGLVAPISSSSIGPWNRALVASGAGDLVDHWISPTTTALQAESSGSADGDCSRLPRNIGDVSSAARALSLACSDAFRLRQIVGRHGSRIDLFSENSRYGDLPALSEQEQRPGLGLRTVARFSPGVWELQLQPTSVQGKTSTAGGRVLSRIERRFARELLFDERDRGDELPPRYAYAVGARSQELAFEQVMQRYVASRNSDGGSRSAPTLIVASDVRDQLVVARAVRVAEPDVQLVFFDADQLLSHPAYVGATRGALVLPAGSLVQCGADGTLHRFAKDEMALVFRSLHVWLDPRQRFLESHECRRRAMIAGQRSPVWQKPSVMMVTRSGLRGPDEFLALRSREVWPPACAALGLAFLFVWSAHGGRGYVAQFKERPSEAVLQIALALAIMLPGYMGLMSAGQVTGWMSVEHVGKGVSLALAWAFLLVAMAVAITATFWALFAESTRERTLLLDPSALPDVPPFWVAWAVVGAGFLLHHLFTSGLPWHGAASGPSFGGNEFVLSLVPLLATTLSLVAALGLGMAYRGWMMLRRDAALCDIKFSKEFAHTWVGSTALPPYATPYLARHDPALEAIAWQSRDMHGTVNRRRILACDIVAIRAWLHGSVVVAMLGVFAVQAYPMAGHARLLQINLLVGLLGIGFALILLVTMARNDLLSALFTGRDRLEFGPRFITLVATAVLIGAGLLYLAIAPDGSDWYDDLFVPLLSWVRV